MLNLPQYCYAVSLYIATKLTDLTYPSPDCFLQACNKSGSPYFDKAIVRYQLTDLELEISAALGCKLACTVEPNGDQEFNSYKLYERFASAASFKRESKEY